MLKRGGRKSAKAIARQKSAIMRRRRQKTQTSDENKDGEDGDDATQNSSSTAKIAPPPGGASRLRMVDGAIVINEIRAVNQRKPRRTIESYEVTQEEEQAGQARVTSWTYGKRSPTKRWTAV